MQAKIDTLRIKEVQNNTEQEYLLYPRTLMRCVTDEKGNTLTNKLSDIEAQLGKDIDAHFMTENGFGDLRYLNGKFQYLNESTGEWVDTSVSPQNVYIMNMIPNAMKSFSAMYDINLGHNKLKWEEPDDTIYDGQAFCIVDKVIIRRKLGSAPVDENDGDLVIEVPRYQFGIYKNTAYVDYDVTPVEGDTYYYKAFPMNTMGYYNYATINETSATYKDYYLFGFRIDQTESDPASMITYIADNANYKSAYMDYTADTFNYGDWTVDNGAWFMDIKPCMLKYDGTVDYYLDHNDYTLKDDGVSASDVENTSYEGNAMVQIPKVYYKYVNITDDVAEYYFCDRKVDDDYHCWSHIDNNGNEIDYCYMPCYNGSNVNSVLRSISGQTPIYSQAGTTEITYAKANNRTDDVIWYTEVFCDRQLVNLLVLLLGKSTDAQAVFGNGRCSSSSLLTTGTLNSNGLFYGTNGKSVGVKIFGMENWWGNQWRRTAGWICDKGTQKVKMTYGQSDGSTTDGYNTDGYGYVVLENSTPSGSNGGYINKMIFNQNGMIPVDASGSATTYYVDGMWLINSTTNYAVCGGVGDLDTRAGAFAVNIGNQLRDADSGFGASISCKPFATAT